MPWPSYTVRAFWCANLPDRMSQMPMYAGKYPADDHIPPPYRHRHVTQVKKFF